MHTQTAEKLKTSLSKTSLALAISSCLISSVSAQDESSSADSESTSPDFFEQIIVTGTASGKAIRKVDTAYATTSLSDEDMKKLAPKSTADIFKAVPGVWAESSGGVSGANVFVRGFPGGGDAPFLTVQLQGVPVFQPPTLSFLENSTLFRLDETVAFMDGLRGGPNSVVSNGQPGLTTNFLLKEGSDETEGLVKYTTSSYDLQRLDAVLSGALADDLYFMVGGYVQQSSGIRDAGFNSEKGNQFTINITKELENGSFNLFSRITDDHGTWYLPTPLIDGVDNEYTQIGTLNRQATIQFGSEGTSQSFDFGDGRGWDGAITGGSINLEFGDGWTFVDRFAYTQGDANTLGLVPNGNPTTISQLSEDNRYLNTDGTLAAITGAVTGNAYSGDTPIQQIGRWVVLKEIEAFTNDLAITKESENFSATVGLYSSSFSANDWWSLGNHAYHVVTPGGESLTGISCNDFEDSCGWNYDITSTGDGTTTAFYGALEYRFNEKITADIGLRQENHEIEYSVDEGLDGTITKFVQYDESDTAWTLGGNYQFTRNAGVFVRASKGSKMPYFDDFRDNYAVYQDGGDLIQDVTQYELGFKIAESNYNLYATGFFSQADDVSVSRPGEPVTANENEAIGVELDAAYFNDNGFSITLNATIQDTEIVKSETTPAIVGNEAKRQPGWQLRLTPSYDFDLGAFYANAYTTFVMVDDRFSNDGDAATGEQIVLDGYEQLDVGISVLSDDGLKFELSMQNVTDEEGLTEGDPRTPNSENGRFIMPRTATFSISYEF